MIQYQDEIPEQSCDDKVPKQSRDDEVSKKTMMTRFQQRTMMMIVLVGNNESDQRELIRSKLLFIFRWNEATYPDLRIVDSEEARRQKPEARSQPERQLKIPVPVDEDYLPF